MLSSSWRQRGFLPLLWTAAILLVVAGFLSPLGAMDTKDMYTNQYDNFDVEELLKQERLLNHYIRCLEDKGPCTPDGKILKGTI